MEQYGGFWRRVGAYLIDAILLGIVVGILSTILGLDVTYQSSFSDSGGFGGGASATGGTGANLLSIALGLAYFAGMESSSMQATLGKKALGMVVTDLNGNRLTLPRAIGRYFAKILSALILFIGYIMVAFTERRQGLHDIIAGTLVHVGNPTEDHAQTFS